MNPETLLTLVSGKSLPLSEPVGGARPEWTLAELGMASAGMGRRATLAFWYRYARDPSCYSPLYGCLLNESARMACERRWPDRIDGQRYLDDLVRLALAEDHMNILERHKLHEALPRWWHVEVWTREVSPKYRAISAVLDHWCAIAHGHMAHKLREEGED